MTSKHRAPAGGKPEDAQPASIKSPPPFVEEVQAVDAERSKPENERLIRKEAVAADTASTLVDSVHKLSR